MVKELEEEIAKHRPLISDTPLVMYEKLAWIYLKMAEQIRRIEDFFDPNIIVETGSMRDEDGNNN